jgi:hypothetical protein
MRFAWWVLPVVGLAGTACGSGQTGSAECPAQISCGCEFFVGRIAARGRVVEVDGASGRAVIELEETLGAMPFTAAPPPGQRVVGPFAVFQPSRAKAQDGCEDTRAAPLVVDEQVLVTLSRADYERVGCTNCPDGCDAGCVAVTEPPTLETSFWVLPWAPQYDFAGTVVSSTELSTVSQHGECVSRFPAPQKECIDHAVVDGPFGACALAPGSSGRAWLGLVALALAGAFRHFRRGRRRH